MLVYIAIEDPFKFCKNFFYEQFNIFWENLDHL